MADNTPTEEADGNLTVAGGSDEPQAETSTGSTVDVGTEPDPAREAAVEQAEGTAPASITTAEARLAQFPSLLGKPGVEVAERSADQPRTSSTRHVKVFVAPPGFTAEGYDHTANFNATRQYMIGLGLRPNEPVRFDGASTAKDGVSVNLTYSVSATPAVIAVDPEVVHATATQGR